MTLGHFTFDGIRLIGPQDYLESRGLALLDKILAGEDALVNSLPADADEETAVLARLSADYDEWKGG